MDAVYGFVDSHPRVWFFIIVIFVLMHVVFKHKMKKDGDALKLTTSEFQIPAGFDEAYAGASQGAQIDPLMIEDVNTDGTPKMFTTKSTVTPISMVEESAMSDQQLGGGLDYAPLQG